MSSKLDYLKKYMSGGDGADGGDGTRKKRKKKKKRSGAVEDKPGVIKRGITIIDDDAPPVWDKNRSDSESDAPVVVNESTGVEQDAEPMEIESRLREEERTAWSVVKPGKEGEHNDSDDTAPPRRARHDSDGSASPPRRARHDSDGSASPPRRARHDSDGSASPPRRARHDSDGSASPPRRARHDSDGSASPPRRARHDSDSERDQSPPRRTRRDSDDSGDQSPLRRRERGSRWGDSGGAPSSVKQEPDASASTNRLAIAKPGAKKTGLQSGAEFKIELLRKQLEAEKQRKARTAEEQGKDAVTVYRDKHGRPLEMLNEMMKQDKGVTSEESKMTWGPGQAQRESEAEKEKYAESLKAKPMARYADDEDLNEELMNKTRWGDPMAGLVKNKRKTIGRKNKFPPYTGPPAAPNRFNIQPGHRWDGVDRGNGFEAERFKELNRKKARKTAEYQWSVSDM